MDTPQRNWLSRLPATLLAGAILLGCGGRLGPVVTDVKWTAKGELEITRCILDISSAGNITSYSMEDCTRTLTPPPTTKAQGDTTTPAPSAGSATVVH